MRLEDALLFVVFHADAFPAEDIYDLCCGAIGVGADIIALKHSGDNPDSAKLEAAAKSCRDEDALFFVWNSPELATELGAAGVHLGAPDLSIGNARGIAGVDSIVGISTGNTEDAALAAEVGADYIVHTEGAMCAAVFEQMRGSGLSYLYAGGFADVEEARGSVGHGVFRVCIEIDNCEDAKPESIAEYSRLFGRVV